MKRRAAYFPVDIIFEDDDILVVNKPAGMIVHPAPGHPDGTLVDALLAHCPSMRGVRAWWTVLTRRRAA